MGNGKWEMGNGKNSTLHVSESPFPIPHFLFTVHCSPFTIHHSRFTIHRLFVGYTETRFAHRITATNNDSNSATYLRGPVMTRRDHTGARA